MATEIERKFLVCSERWRSLISSSVPMRQGYLSNSAKASVRVRIESDRALLNIKSARLGIWRHEYEYEIPIEEAREMLNLCEGPLIEKTRYHVPFGRHIWEVDVFEGDNKGLIVAEIELDNENEAFDRPDWIGAEVSHDSRYYNVSLVEHPYKDWLEK